MFESKESKINQIYDVGTIEQGQLEQIHRSFLKCYQSMGYENIETTPFVERKRYLSATKIHPSKIFEVVRQKERSTFLLQSDLALNMSRYVADLEMPGLKKLYQCAPLYRDRIAKQPGYRKNFKQILIGVWGGSEMIYDVELIVNAFSVLSRLYPNYHFDIQLSHLGIFETYYEGACEAVRFDGLDKAIGDHAMVEEKNYLDNIMKLGLIKPRRLLENLQSAYYCFGEVMKLYKLSQAIYKELGKVEIGIDISNLEGSNHYSGLTYRIYMSLERENVLVGDGGRIDSMVGQFSNHLEMPAACMGIGIQILAQLNLIQENCQRMLLFCYENDYFYGKMKQEYLIKEGWSVSIVIIKRDKEISKYKKYYHQFGYTLSKIENGQLIRL